MEAMDAYSTNDVAVTATSINPIVVQQEIPRMSRARIMKNLLVVSSAFLCLFTSYQSLVNLQSSLNKEEGLGTGGLATTYGALVLSSLFLPPFLIGRIGCKWTVAFSALSYILYMAANIYPTWATILPTAILLGFGAAPLWSSKCTYLTQISSWYAKKTGKSESAVLNTFFGIFYMIFQSNHILGNLLSSQVLGETKNRTVSMETVKTCGVNFCPSAAYQNTNLEKPHFQKIYILCGILIGIAFLSFLLLCFGLDPITLDKEDAKEKRKFSFQLTLETLRHLKRSKCQKLLLVLTIYSGYEQAFVMGDFTKSFVGCVLGIENIGYVMISFGVCDAIGSLCFGRLVQYVGHIPFFVLGFLIHCSSPIYFLLWQPHPDAKHMLYILAGLWGLGDAVMQAQINALYGLLFPNDVEAAFSNHRLWQSIGFIISFSTQNYLCTDVKIYICLALLITGMILYGIAEVTIKRNNNQMRREIKIPENQTKL